MAPQVRRTSASWVSIISLTVMAWSLAVQGCGPKERNFADGSGGDGGLGGNDGAGGSGTGGTDHDGPGGNGGEGGATGGANPGGGGTGGEPDPVTVACGTTEYPAPTVEGDWACQTFDGPWPPEAPWTLAVSTGDLSIIDDLFVTPPHAMRLSVPPSGSPNAKLRWANTAGGDITELRLELELMQNSLPAAPPPWEEPLAVACVDFGQTEGCLLYQWANGGYSLRITNYQTIPQSDDCNIPGTPTANSWTHVVLTLDDAGDLVFEMEGEDPVTCSRGSGIVGTIASVWVGMEGASDDRYGYSPVMDNVFALVTRE